MSETVRETGTSPAEKAEQEQNSLPTSTIFVSGTSESVSYFLEFSCIKGIFKI